MPALPFLLARWSFTLIELILLLPAIFLLLRRKPRKRGAFAPWFQRIARNKPLANLAVGTSVLVLRISLMPLLGVPQPQWHDEFSYLLAADTFAHGRLTNQTPPLWQHYETFHVIFQPTYMSIYPPAQGLLLAAGKLLGHPWIGQLIVTAAMCSAICWMLQGWVPPAWALVGAILAVLRLGVVSYWMNSYWSASIVALGGALVLGALPRLKCRVAISTTLWMMLGVIILANSRPYEGLVLCTMVAASLGLWLAKKKPAANVFIKRAVIPGFLFLALGAVATGFYYHRVTGSAFRMTYQVDRSTYGSVPFFLFQPLRAEPEYRHTMLRYFYDGDRADFLYLRTLRGFVHRSGGRVIDWWHFYLGPLLTIPLLAIPCMLKDRRMRFAFVTLAAIGVAMSACTWFLPHYFAPATALLYLLVVQGLRHMSLWKWPRSRSIASLLIMVACSVLVVRLIAIALHLPLEWRWPRGNLERARISSMLDEQGGQQLVIVRYKDTHDPALEWVYNSASLENSKIVWARDMGRDRNAELLNHFSSRQAWLLEPDTYPIVLKHYQP